MFIALRIPLGLETIMVLFIDVGTDLAPAVSLAYEEPEDAIMKHVFLITFKIIFIIPFNLNFIF